MVSYDELKQFIAFSHAGTLSEAAEQFHISQPTITRSMQKIEAEFGVPLFVRKKNRIELNDNGRLAASQAEKVIEQTDAMFQRVRSFDRASHTISLGACISGLLPDIIRRLNVAFPNAIISAETKPNDALIKGLMDDLYQLILLPMRPGDDLLASKAVGKERLLFCLPKTHRFADREHLTLSEMNGENMLLYYDTGFWHDIIAEKMPDSHFLVQNERYTLNELIRNSVLPNFKTDITERESGHPEDRVIVPIDDPEVSVTYYLTCKKTNRQRFARLFVL